MMYPETGVRVGHSPNGLGVFSLRFFEIRQLIGPIQGTVMEDPLYESDYCMELGEHSALEPEAPFRYLNHSCHPNCMLVEFEVDREDGSLGERELWLQTVSEIAVGEQLTIDYGWPAQSAVPCACGCPDCRGWIVAAEELDQVRTARRGALDGESSPGRPRLAEPSPQPPESFAESPRLIALRKTPPRHRGYLRRLYRLWAKWNGKFFAGKLTTPQILLDRSGGTRSYGSCGPSSCPGARSRIRLSLSLLTGTHPKVRSGKRFARSRFRLVAEVLLHEMVHQWRREVVGDGDRQWRNHGPAFCQKCNEIGRQARLLPVHSVQEAGANPGLPSCAHWPHNARRRIPGSTRRGRRGNHGKPKRESRSER